MKRASGQRSPESSRTYHAYSLLLTAIYFDFSRTFNSIFGDLELFGSNLFILGFLVMLLYHHKVYALASAFILSFYEFIKLIHIIVNYSLILSEWNNNKAGIVISDSDWYIAEGLAITCLVCACLSWILVSTLMLMISDEWKLQSRSTSSQQRMISVAYTNSAATIPSN